MDDEKKRILKMLEQGEITSSEADVLLSSIDSGYSDIKKDPSGSYYNYLTHTVESAAKSLDNDMEQLSKEFAKSFKSLDNELYESIKLDTRKLSEVLKSLQQELGSVVGDIINGINKSTQAMAEKLPTEINSLESSNRMINLGIEDINNSFNLLPSNLSNMADRLSSIYGDPPAAATSMKDYSLTFQKDGQEVIRDLDLECINGNIYFEINDNNTTEIDLYCKTPEADVYKAISVIDEPGMLSVKAVKPDNIMLRYSIKVPQQKLGQIRLSSKNSRLRINGLICSDLICSLSDTKLMLSGLECDLVEIGGDESRIDISDTKSQRLLFKGSNSSVSIENVYSNNMDISTTSSKVSLIIADSINGKNEIKLSQEGEAIDIDLVQLPPMTGIYIDAFAKLGKIELCDIEGFSYSLNEQNRKDILHIIGQTDDYENALNSVRLIIINAQGSIYFK